MNNKHVTEYIPDTRQKKKSAGDTVINAIGYMFFAFVGLLLIWRVALGLGGSDLLEPQAQKTYDIAKQTLCEAEKTLAHAKLTDYLHGYTELTEEDVARLNSKKNQECPF
jgi:hypothetical protein